TPDSLPRPRPGAGAALRRRGLWPSAPQVLRQRDLHRLACQPVAVDLHILQHALDVVAGLGERHALDPLHGIDAAAARIAEVTNPSPRPRRPGIVRRGRLDVLAI